MSDVGASTGDEIIGVPGLEDAELIGRGGAAVVYRARQTSLRRTVAVKLLSSAWDESVARRFDREQRAMGRLSSRPGIVPVYESGLTDKGVPYIVMPYYPDGSLKDLSERIGPIPWQRAAELLLDIADAVGRAHDEGVVHRDLKPANILLSSTGRPLVSDFGIARLASDGLGIETTAVAFTPAYCPPEVLDESDPAPQADTYALAATFWALVRGRPPFTDSETGLAMEAVLKRVLTESAERLDEAPDPIAAFIERSMSKDPADRPADGRAFATQLAEAVASSTIGAVDSSAISTSDATVLRSKKADLATEPTTRSSSRKRKLLSGALLLCLAVAALWVALWSRNPGETAGADDGADDTSDLVIPSGESLMVLPLATEAESSNSVDTLGAARLAVQDFGTVLGVEVEISTPLEVPCQPNVDETTLSALSATGAALLIGDTCREAAAGVMEAAGSSGISWISSNLRSPALTSRADRTEGEEHVDGFFRTAQNDTFQGTVAAQFAIDELAADSAIIISGSIPGSAEIVEAFISSFGSDRDVTVIDLEESPALSAATSAWEEARADVGLLILDADSALDFTSALSDGAARDTPRIAIANVLDEGTAARSVMVGTFVVVPQQPAESAIAATGRSLAEIANDHESATGRAPDDLVVFAAAYDATALGLEALRETAQVTEGGLTIDRVELRRFLESATSEGLTGRITCDFFGDCGSQAMAIVELDGVSEATTLENVVKLFTRQG